MENLSKFGDSFGRHQNPSLNLRLHPRESYLFQAPGIQVRHKILKMLQEFPPVLLIKNLPHHLARPRNQIEVQSQATQIRWKEARFLVNQNLDHEKLPI